LFALHPIQTEAVTYITGRSASLSTCFLLLASLLYAEGVRSGRARYWLGFTSMAFAAAVATKETCATLPFALVLWELLIERPPLGATLRRAGPWLALGVATALLLVMHPRYFAMLYDVIGQRALLDSLRYQLAGLAYLAERLSLLGAPCVDPGLWLTPPRPWVVAATAFVGLGALGLAGSRWRRQPLVLFGLCWFMLQVFLPFVVLPRVDVINERHAYVGNVGLCLACGALWDGSDWLSRHERWRARLPWLMALGLAALTFSRNLDYRSEVALWQSTVLVAPRNPRAQNNLGVAYELAGRNAEARSAYARALVLEPRYLAARDNFMRITNPQQ
jgi:hypothetical protein